MRLPPPLRHRLQHFLGLKSRGGGTWVFISPHGRTSVRMNQFNPLFPEVGRESSSPSVPVRSLATVADSCDITRPFCVTRLACILLVSLNPPSDLNPSPSHPASLLPPTPPAGPFLNLSHKAGAFVAVSASSDLSPAVTAFLTSAPFPLGLFGLGLATSSG